jgi:haloacetate dehalogenase
VFFDGFELSHIDVGEATLRVRHGGTGPPVLLLHGHPRTHTTWYRVAPRLADRHRVVCPDLRGYGESSKPAADSSHAAYSKRAMADDCLALMRTLGHERFAVVGHDRGAYVAYRLALDCPAAVAQLAVLEGMPLIERLDRCDARFALSWWHWFFLGQTDKPAERVICADPDAWYSGDEARMGAENFADWRRAIHDPETVHAMCEDYRAGLAVDRRHDEEARAAGRRIGCPLLFVHLANDDPELDYDYVEIWRRWAADVRAASIPCGHHVAEEAPEELVGVLREFLDR